MNMPQAAWLLAVSDEALLRLTSKSVLERGYVYAHKGAVVSPEIPVLRSHEGIALRATVLGTEAYETRVAVGANDRLQGECDCPHANDGYFCKHQVALALSLRRVLAGDAAAPDAEGENTQATTSRRTPSKTRNREAVRDFLSLQDAASLADRLWAWATQDSYRMKELQAWAAKEGSKDDPAALKLAITAALRNTRDFLDWRESGVYAAHAGQILEWLTPWLEKDASVLLDLCEHALRKLYAVAERADDSNGEVGDLIRSLVDLFIEAVGQAQPPAKWLDRWMALMKADPFGSWDEAAVMAVAGPVLQAKYADKARVEREDWCAKHAGSSASAVKKGRLEIEGAAWVGDRDGARQQLRQRYLLGLSLQTDDPRALLEAMSRSATAAHEWVEVVALCETHGWHRESMQWAQRAFKQFPEDRRLEEAVLHGYERDGWDQEALEIRRKRLNKLPNVEHYKACLVAAVRAGHERAVYRETLMQWAQEREVHTVLLPQQRVGEPRRRETVRNVSVRVAWWLSDGELDTAFAVVQPPHWCDPKQMRKLARALPGDRDADAAQLLKRVFEAWMPESKSPYVEALSVVKEACSRLPILEARAWTDALRSTYKARRNFVARLPVM